jgi:integration host factor subunit beta
VEIRNFGTFTARLRRARVGRNPRTGERVDVPIRRVPRFTSSRSLLGEASTKQSKANGARMKVIGPRPMPFAR